MAGLAPTKRRLPGKSRVRKHAKSPWHRYRPAKLQLTPMIDMFTILLIFLLKSFTAQGQVVTITPDVHLPQSTAEKPSRYPMVVSATNKIIKVIYADEKEKILRDIDKLLIDKKRIIGDLYDELKSRADYTKEIERRNNYSPGTLFKGEITVLGDKEIPYRLLEKIMYTCGRAGYANIDLAVFKKE